MKNILIIGDRRRVSQKGKIMLDWDSEINEPNEYAARLASDPKWIEVSNRVKERDGCCQMCKSTKNLRAHHKSYVDFYNEDYLITLCDKCHEQVHEITKKFKEARMKIQTAAEEEIAKVVDPFVIERCAELSPNGTVWFFRGPMQYRVNLNDFITKLLTLDPYGTEMQRTGNVTIHPCGEAKFTRYMELYKKKKEGEPT